MILATQGMATHFLLRSAPKESPGLEGEKEGEGEGGRRTSPEGGGRYWRRAEHETTQLLLDISH